MLAPAAPLSKLLLLHLWLMLRTPGMRVVMRGWQRHRVTMPIWCSAGIGVGHPRPAVAAGGPNPPWHLLL